MSNLIGKISNYILKNKDKISKMIDKAQGPQVDSQELTPEYFDETLERLIKKQVLRDKEKKKQAQKEFEKKVMTESDRDKGLSGRGKREIYIIADPPSQWDD